jgi:hypothetical protein
VQAHELKLGLEMRRCGVNGVEKNFHDDIIAFTERRDRA